MVRQLISLQENGDILKKALRKTRLESFLLEEIFGVEHLQQFQVLMIHHLTKVLGHICPATI